MIGALLEAASSVLPMIVAGSGIRASVANPEVVAPGTPHTVTLQIQNSGNVTTDYRVQAYYGNPSNNQQNYTGVISYADIAGVAAGATFQVTVPGAGSPSFAVPATPGTYPVMVTIFAIQSGAATLGSSAWVGGLRQVQPVPPAVGLGPIDNVTVQFNLGATETVAGFPAAPVTFSSQFGFTVHTTNQGNYMVDQQLNCWVDNPTQPGNALTPGSGAPYPPYQENGIPIGDTVTFQATLLAPLAPGQYLIKAHLFERQAGTSQWYTPSLAGLDAAGDAVLGTITVPTAIGAAPTISLVTWS